MRDPLAESRGATGPLWDLSQRFKARGRVRPTDSSACGFAIIHPLTRSTRAGSGGSVAAPNAGIGPDGMRLNERIVGDVVIVAIVGDLILSHGGDLTVKDRVRALIRQGRSKLLIDLGEVSQIDSAGLGELVQAYVTTKNHGGSLKLLRVTKRIDQLLTMTKLTSVFESYGREADALASFSGAAV